LIAIDHSELEVGEVSINIDNEKDGISRPSKNCCTVLLVLQV
jgi:hypothetical protein